MTVFADQKSPDWTEEDLCRSITELKSQQKHSELNCFLRERIADKDSFCTANRTRLWNELGLSMLQQEDIPQAADCFQESLQIDPDNSTALYNLANLALHQKDFESALQQYGAVLKSDAEHFGALFNSALCHVYSDDIDSALPLFVKAGKIKPEDARLQFWAGECLLHSGRHKEALPFFKRAYSLNPRHFESAQGLAITLLETQRYEDAVEICDSNLMSFGPSILPLRVKGDALLALDRIDDAVLCHLDMAHLDLDARDFLVSRIKKMATEEPTKMSQYKRSMHERCPDFEGMLSISLGSMALAETSITA